MMRIGFGTDVHRLVVERPLMIGGVEIPSDLGADGHSDADVLLHALTDAILGALALGDIGEHFPDTDERWAGASSTVFLTHALELAGERGFSIANVDCVLDLEAPKLRPHIHQIRSNVAAALRTAVENVSVKAKTGERLDAVGRGQAIRCQAMVLLADRSSEPID